MKQKPSKRTGRQSVSSKNKEQLQSYNQLLRRRGDLSSEQTLAPIDTNDTDTTTANKDYSPSSSRKKSLNLRLTDWFKKNWGVLAAVFLPIMLSMIPAAIYLGEMKGQLNETVSLLTSLQNKYDSLSTNEDIKNVDVQTFKVEVRKDLEFIKQQLQNLHDQLP